MYRRALLRSGASAGFGAVVGGTVVASSATASGRAPASSSARSASDESVSVADDAYEPLGVVEISGAAEAVVGDGGETVYLAVTDGFAIVDVSDPTEPTLLAEERDLLGEEHPPLTEILDVKVDGDRLVVPGPGNQSDPTEEFHGFVLYDVSDPESPVPASEPYETGFHIHNCYLEDDLLYLVGNDGGENPLVVVDASDDDPEEVGRWSLLDVDPEWGDVDPILRYLHDVYVHDDVAYLAYWNAGTYLLDVSDPAEPAYLSHVIDPDVDLESQRELEGPDVTAAQLGLPGSDHYSAVDETGELLGVGREAWETDAEGADGPGGIDLYDVRDPTDPTKLATIDAPESADATYGGGLWTTAHNFELSDGRLYSSWYQGGVKIHDVSDPSTPEELASWRDPQNAGFWTARVATDDAFVASSTPLIPGAGTEGALYAFSRDPGEQANQPSLTDVDDAGELDAADDDSGDNDAAADDSDDSDDAESASGGDEVADSIPGFAGAAGVTGGALALEWLRRRDGER